ncbi:hypothetical protein Pla8534_27130 [Lignipirellula cremea]|uniref:Uncharacterized protein n=1 Tax=Lignipirellula cremea TaxID=2528010 RepID=A0A518DST8_9BACT|nr:hypothetical protein Pla8534_27130 [Lignipirellula cremea]
MLQRREKPFRRRIPGWRESLKYIVNGPVKGSGPPIGSGDIRPSPSNWRCYFPATQIERTDVKK